MNAVHVGLSSGQEWGLQGPYRPPPKSLFHHILELGYKAVVEISMTLMFFSLCLYTYSYNLQMFHIHYF